MQLVEQHVINRNDTRFPLIDAAAFAAKNLYVSVQAPPEGSSLGAG